MAQIDNLRRIAEALDGIDKDDNVYNETQDDYLARIATAIENGGGSSNLIIETFDETTYTYTLNKTWKEIYDMMQTGAVFIKATGLDEGGAQNYLVGGTQVYNGRYDVYATVFWNEGVDGTYTYSCQNENDYPVSEH